MLFLFKQENLAGCTVRYLQLSSYSPIANYQVAGTGLTTMTRDVTRYRSYLYNKMSCIKFKVKFETVLQKSLQKMICRVCLEC